MHWDQIARLPIFAQQDLHRFYLMSKDLYDDDALTHRREATLREPSLPQQAGRAFAQLERIMRQAQLERDISRHLSTRNLSGRRHTKSVRVYALARPEIDYARLARALVEHARTQGEIEHNLLRNSDKLVPKFSGGTLDNSESAITKINTTKGK